MIHNIVLCTRRMYDRRADDNILLGKFLFFFFPRNNIIFFTSLRVASSRPKLGFRILQKKFKKS